MIYCVSLFFQFCHLFQFTLKAVYMGRLTTRVSISGNPNLPEKNVWRLSLPLYLQEEVAALLISHCFQSELHSVCYPRACGMQPCLCTKMCAEDLLEGRQASGLSSNIWWCWCVLGFFTNRNFLLTFTISHTDAAELLSWRECKKRQGHQSVLLVTRVLGVPRDTGAELLPGVSRWPRRPGAPGLCHK